MLRKPRSKLKLYEIEPMTVVQTLNEKDLGFYSVVKRFDAYCFLRQ